MILAVRDTTDADAASWDSLVARFASSSIYHRYAWRGFYRDVFDKETHYLAAVTDDGDVRGVLPLVRQKSRLFGDYLASVPFFNYGGVLATDESARTALFEHAARLGRELGVDHVELRDTETCDGWATRTDKVAMILKLPDNEEALASQLGSKLRSQIRRPKRDNPVVKKGGAELLEDFYAVFCRNMRDLGTPVYSKSMFLDILRRFTDETELVMVYFGETPAAAAFLIHHDAKTEIPWASSIRDFNRTSVNMLLYWEALCSAIDAGSGKFDFGRSSKDSGTYRFKKQWGAEPLQLRWHYWLQSGDELPGLNPDSGKFDLAIKVWQRLPLWLANRLGPSIVQHLP